jgi:hypothetical protein
MANSMMSLVSESSLSPSGKMNKDGKFTAFSVAMLEKFDEPRTHTPAAKFDISRTFTPAQAKANVGFSLASLANLDKEDSVISQTSIGAKSPGSRPFFSSIAS